MIYNFTGLAALIIVCTILNESEDPALLSVPTLHLVNIALHLIAGLCLIVAGRSFRGGAPLGLWGLSNLLYALGFLTVTSPLAGSHALIGNLIGNLLIDAGTVVAYVSLCLFLKSPRRTLWLLLPAGLFSLAKVGLFLVIGLHLPANVVLGCLCRVLLTVGSAWILWHHAEPELRPASGVLAGFQLIWAVILVARVVWELGIVIPTGTIAHGDLGGDPTTPVALLLRCCVTFTLTIGYLWMLGRRLEMRLNRLARQDPLTRVANRRALWEAGDSAMTRAHQQGWPLAVLMIDVDHFKSVNDRWGHGVGDRVLTAVATTISASLRNGDLLGRVGGEEFAVLLPDAGAEAAANIAERIRKAVEMLVVDTSHGSVTCTISAGVAMLGAHSGWDRLIDDADEALYRAKTGGRNRVETATG